MGNRGFVACLVLMVGVLGTYETLMRLTGTKVKKLPVPLRSPLGQLDSTRLEPYKLIQAMDIKPEQLDALGTREYISWLLEDTSVADRNAPERWIRFFVTYYTDTPGQVPHVPEECYLGGGYTRSSEEVVQVPVPDLSQSVAVKMLVFERSGLMGRETRTVLYTFHTNGRFAPDRQMVRAILNNPRDTHAYFSKVEISFGTGEVSPPADKAVEAGRRFLAKVLPILVKEHWPDWKSVEQKGAAAAGAAEATAKTK
jgi:hypothetical protein